MSDDFVRCPECGNLNIPGTEKCVFCGAELPKIEGKTEEVKTFSCPSCKTELPETVTSCPICGWSKEAEAEQVPKPSTAPEAPFVPSVPKPTGAPKPEVPSVPTVTPPEEKEEVEVPKVSEEETVTLPEIPEIAKAEVKEEEKPVVVEKRSTFVTVLIILGFAVIQYGLNFLIGWVSISILDPNVELYPNISSNLEEMITINHFAILLHLLFGAIIGFLLAKILQSRLREKKIYYWFWGSIATILVINIGVTVLILAVLMPRNILFAYILLSTAIYVITNIITLFFPYILGAFLLFDNINNLFLRPKKHLKPAVE